MLMLDTKVNLLCSFDALGIKISKKLLKGELVSKLILLFDENPFFIINRLSKEEQDILTHLVACKQDECVKIPISEQPNNLQKHHLVATFVLNGEWKLYMPDSIRRHIDKCAMSDLSLYPGMKEWEETLMKLNILQRQVEADVKLNPTTLPIEHLHYYKQRLQDEISELQEIERHLRKLESQISQYNVDFGRIYDSIQATISEIETKQYIMSLFVFS